ncbi:C40 family peptidase [Lysobacter soli]|uniref:C40 family peptidase n=1 Tax=Lysobacter soli TaxID=453783 RepID=UPI0037CAFE91
MNGLANFVGIPYLDRGRTLAGADCYGLVRLALQALRGIELPDYGTYAGGADHDGITETIERGLHERWRAVTAPVPFDLIVLRVAGKPRHVGLVVAPERFLHAPEPLHGRGGTSRIECWTDRLWINRIEGFYRHAS